MMSTLLHTTIAVVLAFAVLPTGAAAQANCEWYAKTALKQQKDNEQFKCNLKGQSWHSDLKAHLSWCAGVAPDLWKSEAQKRDQDIAACRKK